MEQTPTTETKNYQLDYHGRGSELFGVLIINWLLTLVSLGLYYPWAKAKQLNYLFGATSLNNDRFAFHGTGQEMFKGFIKAIILFAIIYGIFFLFIYLQMPVIGALLMYIGFLALIPLAIHGSYRYRMSRTSWRGIRFGYRGDRDKLIALFVKGILLTIVTFGIYGAWFAVNLRRYVLSNVRFGNISFRYEADGSDYFWLVFKGYILSILTLGIYSFWWMKEMFAFFVDNLSMYKDGERINLHSKATGGGFFALMVVNFLIIVFTLGLGYAWVVTRTMQFMAENIVVEGDIDLDTISQTEEEFTDATGEDVSDFLNLDITL
ncbi:MAG: DUF898 family protein [Bacteroidota bacterium]